MNEITRKPGLFHPSRFLFKTSILMLIGLMTCGSYFAFDSVNAIATILIEQWKTDHATLELMNTSYNIAAIASVLLGGMLIDRIGSRRASLIFSAFLVAGVITVALAPSVDVALVGRFLFGAGCESLYVATNAMLTRWFSGKALAFSFGFTLSISRLGTLFSFNTESLVATRFGWQAALWVAAALCIVSLGCTLAYFLLDRAGERALKLAPDASSDKISFSDIVRFRPSYWYVVLLCVTFYSAIFPFTGLSTDFFHDKFGLPLTTDSGGSFLGAVFQDFTHMFSTAGGTTSIIIFASMIFAPFAGTLIDRIGKRASLMVVGSLLMVPAHLVMGYSDMAPYLPMIVLGISFVLVPAAMWPAIPLIVEKNRVGTAFGLVNMVQNLGLALVYWLNGALRHETGDYQASMTMFASLGLVGLVFAILLLRSDRREGHVLEKAQAK